MLLKTFGEWKYTVNRDATKRAYAQAGAGGADSCSCSGCRNFRLARSQVFPNTFLQLLDELGIDPLKDVEVYECGTTAPGYRYYGGWYHFAGTLEVTGDFPRIELGEGFLVWMCRQGSLFGPNIHDASVIQLEFEARSVPWLLDEPEPR
jgi:hypothetical protein